MDKKNQIRELIEKLINSEENGEHRLELELNFFTLCQSNPQLMQMSLGYLMTALTNEIAKRKQLESLLKDSRAEMDRIMNGGLIGGIYIGERNGNGASNNGTPRNVRVAVRGSLMEVPLSKELNSQTLIPACTTVFLDQQCRYVTRLADVSESSSLGRIGTVARVLDSTRACVRLPEGRGEVLVFISPLLDPALLIPEESSVRVIELTTDMYYAVEIVPEEAVDLTYADGLGYLPKYTRSDVIGLDDTWDQLERLLFRRLKNRKSAWLYKAYNLDGSDGALAESNGILITGPPGVGKSMLVAAALHELGKLSENTILVKYISGTGFSSKWFGESEDNARRMYRRMSRLAKKTGGIPVIVIDEAGPAFAQRARAADSGGSQAHNDLTNTLLEIIGKSDVITIAIDNTPGLIDEAILRSGRLPVVTVSRPNYRQCVKIAQYNLSKTRLAADESAETLATLLCDFIFMSDILKDLVKVKFVGGTLTTFSAKHLVNGAELVEGIITPAAESALKRDESLGAGEPTDLTGIRWDDLKSACVKRFAAILENIDRYNAPNYFKFPDGRMIQSIEKRTLHH